MENFNVRDGWRHASRYGVVPQIRVTCMALLRNENTKCASISTSRYQSLAHPICPPAHPSVHDNVSDYDSVLGHADTMDDAWKHGVEERRKKTSVGVAWMRTRLHRWLASLNLYYWNGMCHSVWLRLGYDTASQPASQPSNESNRMTNSSYCAYSYTTTTDRHLSIILPTPLSECIKIARSA